MNEIISISQLNWLFLIIFFRELNIFSSPASQWMTTLWIAIWRTITSANKNNLRAFMEKDINVYLKLIKILEKYFCLLTELRAREKMPWSISNLKIKHNDVCGHTLHTRFFVSISFSFELRAIERTAYSCYRFGVEKMNERKENHKFIKKKRKISNILPFSAADFIHNVKL